MTQDLDTFERELLHHLRTTVAVRTPVPSRRPRRRVIAAAGVAAATAAALVFVPGIGGTAAYSVSRTNSGDVDVSVNRLEDAAGLEAALEAEGIDAIVNYVPDGRQCTRAAMVTDDRPGIGLTVGSDTFEVRIAAGTVRDDETFVIDASIVRRPDVTIADGTQLSDRVSFWVSAEVARGAVPPCI